MHQINPPYLEPFVYIGNTEAFVSVCWFNRSTGRYKREKIRLGLKNLDDRKRKLLLYELCTRITAVTKARNAAGQYHDESVFEFDELEAVKYIDEPLLEALARFKNDEENPTYQRNQAQALETRYRQFCEQYPILKFTQIGMITEPMIRKYVKFLQEDKLTGKTINTHLWVLSKVMARIVRATGNKFALDPEGLRVKQIKNETEMYKPLLFKEKEAVFSFFAGHTEEYYRNYHIFLIFLYYTCIRPAELMRIQLKYVNLRDRTIYVPWYKSKNGLSKYVQILNPLYQVLTQLQLEQYHQDHYLFSHRFVPGPIKKTSKNVSELWVVAVKKLSIVERQMYGLKHTFNKDYVENNKNNIDWEWLRRHNRHATIQQTQDYISGLTAYFLDESAHTILDHTKM